MKNYYWVLALLLLVACQQEEFQVVESQDEEQQLSQDDELLNLVKTVATHDGTFDDVVDESSCFSINFPYECTANGKEYVVTKAEDLEPFDMYDKLVPTFPVTVTFANYLELEVPTYAAFKNLIAQCANGDIFDERITCVDLQYPVQLSIYDPVTTNFETRTFNHDRDTFTGIELLNEDWIANISYPIIIRLENGGEVQITSNEELKFHILAYISICD
ncbi:hypothetical protein POV27_15775 [Aureisphaera galaxeae]|uniref:hypothetical protein n=1 Tax=Aureisphaera galaxeae TaxID=1538023 RepID=UPI00234FBE50|nr:hypothetical protein [Aureisphaera galaxeae]MDC8005517.1 hypothetical protein [Aureisphaera galaxeae]